MTQSLLLNCSSLLRPHMFTRNYINENTEFSPGFPSIRFFGIVLRRSPNPAFCLFSSLAIRSANSPAPNRTAAGGTSSMFTGSRADNVYFFPARVHSSSCQKHILPADFHHSNRDHIFSYISLPLSQFRTIMQFCNWYTWYS
jgi:hypothetical protein